MRVKLTNRVIFGVFSGFENPIREWAFIYKDGVRLYDPFSEVYQGQSLVVSQDFFIENQGSVLDIMVYPFCLLESELDTINSKLQRFSEVFKSETTTTSSINISGAKPPERDIEGQNPLSCNITYGPFSINTPDFYRFSGVFVQKGYPIHPKGRDFVVSCTQKPRFLTFSLDYFEGDVIIEDKPRFDKLYRFPNGLEVGYVVL